MAGNTVADYITNKDLNLLLLKEQANAAWEAGNQRIYTELAFRIAEIEGSGAGGSSASGGGFVPVTYEIVGGATGLQGAWDVTNVRVFPSSGGTAIAIGTTTGNARNLAIASGGAAASTTYPVSSQTTQYTAVRNNAPAGIVNTQKYDNRKIVSSINGAVLSNIWISRTAGTTLNTTQVAAINIGSDFGATPVIVTTPVALQSQDWLVVPNAGDTASGLTRRAIAREYVIQDEVGSVTPLWTDANNATITAPTRTNLVKAESGYPETLLVEYAINSAPTVFLNGFAIRLPSGSFELYSDYALTALVAQGAAAAEAIATSIRPRTVSSAGSIIPLTAITASTKTIEVPEPGDAAVAGSATVPFRPAAGALALSATATDLNGIPTNATAISLTVWPSTITRDALSDSNQAYLAGLCLIYTIDGTVPDWGSATLAPNGTPLKFGDLLILSRVDAIRLRVLSNSDTTATTPVSPGRPQITFYGLEGTAPQSPIYNAYDWSLLRSGGSGGSTPSSTSSAPAVRLTSTIVLDTALTEGTFLLANVRQFEIGNGSLVPLRYSFVSGATVDSANHTRIHQDVGSRSESDIFFSGTMYICAESLPTPLAIASTTTNGSAIVTTAASFSDAVVGQSISGAGIPLGARIGAINAAKNSLNLVASDGITPVTATASGSVTLSIIGAVVRLTTWS